MSFLEIRNATKSYGAVKVLHETNIAVEEGEFLVLVGPSGCGKSTLLSMIAGLEDVTSGEISIKGRSMNGVRPADRNIAMVFQSYALYPNMNVAQNMAFGLEMHGVPKEDRDKAVAQVAELLQIQPLLDRKPGQLSGGQRQRVAMGRALVREPAAFLFDEPLSNLDAKLRVQMRAEIRRLQRRLRTTSLYVTHDQLEAMTLADTLVVLNAGRIEQAGSPMEVYERPASLFVATFIGSPAMNLLPLGEQGIPGLTAPEGLFSRTRPAETLGIRPEHMRVVDGEAPRPEEMRFDLTVSGVEVVGAESFVYGTLPKGGSEIAVRVPGYSHAEPGTPLTAAADTSYLHRFDRETGRRI